MNKDIIKEKAIEITKIIAFIIVFMLLLESLSLTVFSGKVATNYKNKFRDAYSFINEPDNTIQIVGVGNSDLYCSLSPLDLWKNYGYTSTVCGSPNQTISESQNLLEQVLETQSPKLVIIEVDMFYDHKPRKNNYVEKTGTMTDFFDGAKPEHFEQEVENTFSIFKFHNYWKGGNSNKKNTPYNAHGYKFNNKVCKLKKKNYMKTTMLSEEITSINKKKIESLISLCRSKKAEVIFVAMPSVSSWNYERHNGVKQYAKGKNIPFLDFNLCYKEMGISMKTCFRDNGNHLNYDGAKAVTEYLGKYISDNYSLENLSDNSSYESWNDSLKKFEKFRKSKEKSANKQR